MVLINAQFSCSQRSEHSCWPKLAVDALTELSQREKFLDSVYRRKADTECSGYLLRYPCTPNSEISVFQHITWGCQVWGSDSQKPVWELQCTSCMSLQPDCNPTAPSMLVHRGHRGCLNPIPICQLSHQVMRRATSSNSKYSTDGVVFFLRLKIPSILLEEGMTHKLFKLQKATIIFSCALYIEFK